MGDIVFALLPSKAPMHILHARNPWWQMYPFNTLLGLEKKPSSIFSFICGNAIDYYAVYEFELIRNSINGCMNTIRVHFAANVNHSAQKFPMMNDFKSQSYREKQHSAGTLEFGVHLPQYEIHTEYRSHTECVVRSNLFTSLTHSHNLSLREMGVNISQFI